MADEVTKQVGARVRRAREARRIPQVELAQALGISQAAISNIESGARPLRVDELVTISRALGEELDFFFAPTREQRGPVGVTLRAEVAGLPLPEFREAINALSTRSSTPRCPHHALQWRRANRRRLPTRS